MGMDRGGPVQERGKIKLKASDRQDMFTLPSAAEKDELACALKPVQPCSHGMWHRLICPQNISSSYTAPGTCSSLDTPTAHCLVHCGHTLKRETESLT